MGDLPGSPSVAPSTLFLHASEVRETRGLVPSFARIREEGNAGIGGPIRRLIVSLVVAPSRGGGNRC
jgi:hypothetical protein